jgi:hypothetical protein
MSPSKGKEGQRVKSGSGGGFWGTRVTLAQLTGHCPGSISGGPADAPSPVQTVLRTSTPVTFGGLRATPEVIHRSYPQAARFHVKHDVERVHPLWIQRWRRCHPSELFHVKRPRGGSSTVSAHRLWILLTADPRRAAFCGGSVLRGAWLDFSSDRLAVSLAWPGAPEAGFT